MFPLSCIVNHSHPISKRYSRSGPSPRQLSRVLYNNQINARSLIGQSAMVYCAINPWKKRASSELLYKGNRPQGSKGYRLINHLGCW